VLRGATIGPTMTLTNAQSDLPINARTALEINAKDCRAASGIGREVRERLLHSGPRQPLKV
jgi:hypothetical protein